jgi:hypothetical protein
VLFTSLFYNPFDRKVTRGIIVGYNRRVEKRSDRRLNLSA